MTLSTLSSHQSARILGIDAPQQIRHRLMELGFVPGAELEVIIKGTPSLIRVQGGRVSLSHELAAAVVVDVT